MMKSSWRILVMQVVLGLGICLSATATSLNYQGRLTGTNGTPINGSVAISVSLYTSSSIATSVYTENMGSVVVANGIFSFDWGMAGTSSVMVIEDIGITTGSNSVYNGTTQHKPMNSGEVAIADGTYVWTDTTGSSSPSDFLGTVSSYSNGTVSAVYLSGNPPAGRIIKVAYRYPVMGCDMAIQSYSNLWLGVTIDGTEANPRRVLGSVPRAVVANTVKGQTLYVDDLTGRVGIGTNNPSSTLTVNGVIESTSGGIKFPDGTVQITASSSETTTVVVGHYVQMSDQHWGGGEPRIGPSVMLENYNDYGQTWYAPLMLPNNSKIISFEGKAFDIASDAFIQVSLIRKDVAEIMVTNAIFQSDTSFSGGETNFYSIVTVSNSVDNANYISGVSI